MDKVLTKVSRDNLLSLLELYATEGDPNHAQE